MFSGLKKNTGMAAALLLSALPLGAAVQVTEGKIVLGNSFQLPMGSPAEFECRITNPDPKPHRVMIRLSPGSYGSVLNSNSPEMVIPARSTTVQRFPIFPATDEKHTFSVFEDGVRRPNSTLNECSVKFIESNTGAVGILNDRGTPPGGFKDNGFLDRRLVPVMFRAGSLPKQSEVLRSLSALVVVEPDFSGYSAEDFAVILEYAANGGLVVFADPAGALAAASTPLADLMGVVPLGIRKVPSHLFRKKKPKNFPVNPFELQFLDTVEKPGCRTERFMENPGTGFPLFAENRYGLGTVRFLAFAPVSENFPGDKDTPYRFTAKLLNVPPAGQSLTAFRAPLDRLTGFTVPHTETVRNILIFYFAVLLVILFLGFRWKRHISAWAVGALSAVLLTAAILIHVKRTIGQRGAIAAVLHVENAHSPGSGRNYISLYAPAAMKTTVKSSSRLNLYELLPFRRFFAFSAPGMDNLNASPLDLRMQADDAMQIHEINLAARTSRQVMEHLSPPVLPVNGVNWKPPRLLLSGEGLKMEPWKIPASARRIEAAFVLFPNGSKAAELSPDGICTMKGHDSAIADPLIEDIRNALEKSHSKKYPAVVLVSDMARPHPGLDPVFLQQGKNVMVYPADVVPVSDTVMIPSELFELTPADTGSRMGLDGGRINTAYSVQPGMTISLKLNLSGAVDFPADYSSLTARVTISGSGRVEPVLSLIEGSGRSARTYKGKKAAAGEYRFSGEDFKRMSSGGKPLQLVVEGVLKKEQRKDTEYTAENWSLLDLKLELRGKKGIANKEKLP